MKSATTTTTYTTSRKDSIPRLILNTSYPNVTTTTKSQATTTTSITLTSSPVTTTGSFYLPSTPQKQSKKSRSIQKHLRKPPAFDTYLRVTEPVNVNGYYNPSKRSSSLSSSCSSTSSEDNGRYPNFTSEEMMYAKKAVSNQPRSRRSSSTTKFVRFADFNDGSSITDSSSGSNSADDWDPLETDEEEEEEFFFMTPRCVP
ncbi:448_t:CDS:1 [Acaulospora morrowiae]|uniref:448_t:CDS:1 n=1 Tax=Acaulospora morrowiae TaxID=94023 RepID=A0A9N8ZXB5_9GLOM|nr:448_t:CDS:1 [Acaulospora morrowiae]